MKVIACFLAILSVAAAFGTAPVSRKAFFSAAAAALAVPLVPLVANAMDQENVSTPTEQWETGSPTPAALAARKERFNNPRTQMTSNYAPIKRLTLERKSPVTRLDINAPNFSAYKTSLPGLYKKIE
jgi:hypothetical protein